MLKSLERMLKNISETNKKPFEILKATDGVEALALFMLDYFLNKSIKFVISDQNMTMMNGLELLKLINFYSKDNNNPRLFINSGEDDSIIAGNLDFIKFISKPANKNDLKKIFSD